MSGQKIIQICQWKQELVNCCFLLVASLARICDDNIFLSIPFLNYLFPTWNVFLDVKAWTRFSVQQLNIVK